VNPGMKMLFLSNRQGGAQSRGPSETRGGYDSPRMGYEAPGMRVGTGGQTESRFSDRTGREHYDNGRFAPMRSEMEGRESGRMVRNGFPDNGPSMHYGGDGQDGGHGHPMGFTYRGGGEEGGEGVLPFSQMTAEKWARQMDKEDGTKGPHWSIEQVKQVMAQKNLSLDPWEFYAALNAMYSDFSKALKKHGVGDKLDLYVDLAKAFIEDPDAMPDKLARYWRYVVRH